MLCKWSEWRDLNPRHLAPQTSALPGCATLRMGVLYLTFKKIARDFTRMPWIIPSFMPTSHPVIEFEFLFFHSKRLFSMFLTNEMFYSFPTAKQSPFLYLPP